MHAMLMYRAFNSRAESLRCNGFMAVAILTPLPLPSVRANRKTYFSADSVEFEDHLVLFAFSPPPLSPPHTLPCSLEPNTNAMNISLVVSIQFMKAAY
jgi:hypothetical protein